MVIPTGTRRVPGQAQHVRWDIVSVQFNTPAPGVNTINAGAFGGVGRCMPFSHGVMRRGVTRTEPGGAMAGRDTQREASLGSDREGCFLVAGGIDGALEKRLNRLAAMLGRNRDTRIEN